MNDLRGSNWRIWDLHVHTPESIVHNYGARNESTWGRFLDDIEALPPSIRILGINDYIFLDGYRRIIAERQQGRIPNIDLILPVIELRLDKFGGTDTKLSRVNFHVIFSDEFDAETIQQQFINALPSAYKLSPEYEGLQVEWSGILTKASLEDLGKRIIANVPNQERHRFGNPLHEGFNNLNVCLDAVLDRLNTSYFKGKYLTAVGKTEWWDIRWNDKSIAEKKNIINSSDLVFIACDEVKDYYRAKESLRSAMVNDKLLDCSDAHSFSSSQVKERLGNCFTWVKADPTFQGLRHVLVEPEERIFVGERPPQLEAVESNKTRYIRSVSIKKAPVPGKRMDELWFDTELALNHGLVAIIGNKGSGKSALADVIGLLGNSRNQEAFSFLNTEKFRKMPENRAGHFEAELQWESDETATRRLDANVDVEEVERVKYIPQNYFEEICTQLGGIEETAFDRELKNVIFSHVGEAERLGKGSLDELIRYKSGEIGEALERARLKLDKVNRDIVVLEDMLTTEYRESLENQLKAKRAELDAVKRLKPAKVKKPSKRVVRSTEALKTAESRKEELEGKVSHSKERRRELVATIAKVDKLTRKLENFEEEVAAFREELAEAIDGLELSVDKIVKIEIDRGPLDSLRLSLVQEKELLDGLLDDENEKSLIARLRTTKAEIDALREQLDKPSKEYQKYQEDLAKWEEKIKEVMGEQKRQGSIANLEWQIEELGRIPGKLSQLYERRRSRARAIHRCIRKQKEILAELYAPVQRFIAEHPDIGKKIDLNFGASIMNVGFEENFFDWVSLSKTGSFMGATDGKRLLNEIVAQHDFNDEDNAVEFAEEIIKALRVNRNAKPEVETQVADQLKKGKTVDSLYTFVYSLGYLQARYVLRLGEKELKQLSPGERGALLIVFYLLVDLDTVPLVIDQPEHNLDNETVTKLLVPAIKRAKLRRQIIIITHNPILAVVCNADQVIAASLDIKDNYRLKYAPGAIENPSINKKIVDILEGTMPAFDNRQRKYIREYLEAYQERAWT